MKKLTNIKHTNSASVCDGDIPNKVSHLYILRAASYV